MIKVIFNKIVAIIYNC